MMGATHMRVRNPNSLSIAVSVAGLLAAGGIVLTLDLGAQAPTSPTAFTRGRTVATEPPHVTLVNEYCLSCHDEDHKKGNLAFETVADDEVARHADVWEKDVRKLRARQMPPIGKKRPDDATYDAVIASLETSLDRAAAAHP